jgi:hypothetical protein
MTAAKTATLRRRKPGDLGQLRRVLWASLLEVEQLVASTNPDRKIRAAHALSTLAGTYLRALQVHELEARLVRLEALIEERDRRKPHELHAKTRTA